jgi:type I restriction enzyme, S subunit
VFVSEAQVEIVDRLRPYPAYRESGVPWLGEMPEHWRTAPGRACYREKKEPNTGLIERTVLSLSYGQLVVKPEEKLHGLVPASFETYQIIEPGDIVVRPTDLQNDWNSLRFGLSQHRGIITSAYMCLHTKNVMTREYGHLLLHAYDLKKVFYGLGSGLRQNLDWRDFKYLPCLVPPLDEQATIVRYLDHVDRRIRQYVRAKQKLIALLNEQKQAIIHRAVTRGLDPNVRLKPSGVEWLGDVPEHWESARLKAVLSRPMRNGLFKKKDVFGSGVPLINVADVYRDNFTIEPASLDRVQATPDEVQTYQVQPGDLFFVRSSLKLEGTGRSAVAIACEPDSVFECHLVQGRPCSRRANPRFLALQLNSFALRHYLISRANFVTMATVAQDVFAACPVWLPPLSEQHRVLEYVDDRSQYLNSAIGRAVREIALLREYRTRLIADVVTGRLDVRKAAAALPEEAEEEAPLDESEVLAEEEAAEANDDVNGDEGEIEDRHG